MVATGFNSHPDFGDHIVRRYHPAPQHVTAFFGELLILQLDGAGPGSLVSAHRVHDIEQAAIPRVTITDQGRIGNRGILGDTVDHVGITCKPGVWQPQVGGHRAITGHVEGLKAHLVRHFCRDHFKHTGR